ncbi:hypothetical protein FISHEDRAFT_69789 [Fistulina hepatica ATCC 64428]|uniref:CxC2-like cysteine cluster KDZ transposase-associated domain-containing protein n=1 Tax=Fistulina hepatica ATCC 64428 TaxID=1128425 RepID=A0A0D7AMJ2_9AGAR|nr:hypothetical protein FISHEDRAFT_69789 [Fistulina hepatica ATCC 64428]
MPDGWEENAYVLDYTHALFLATDTNFRLCRRNVGSAEDVPFINGTGYFVNRMGLIDHVEKWKHLKQEKSDCVSHDAVNSADTRETHGMDVTGIVTIDCARHDCKRPLGVGELQKGERYVNVDYILHSTLHNSRAWFIDMAQVTWNWLVPKFHLIAHVLKCRLNFSFNFERDVGHTEGEAPERNWGSLNPLASQMKEMGPRNWRDCLEYHLGNRNYKKKARGGEHILQKFKAAIPMRAAHLELLKDFETSLNAAEIAAWTAEVEAWESDHSQPNPYEPKLKPLMQRDVRLCLAEEEKAEATRAAALGHIRSKLTAQKLLLQGLELEELQRKLRRDVHALGQHATSLQKAKTMEFGTSLQGHISRWTRNAEVHLLCIPSLAEVDAEAAPENAQVPPPYDLKIWMPGRSRSDRTRSASLVS